MSESLQPHESQHARPPCPSPTPGVYSNSCPSSRWCHPAISSSVIPFSSCPQSLPASGSFLMSQLFTWGGQSTGVSASASVLPMNTQDWSPSLQEGLVGSPCSSRDSQEPSPTPQFKSINSKKKKKKAKASILRHSAFLQQTNRSTDNASSTCLIQTVCWGAEKNTGKHALWFLTAIHLKLTQHCTSTVHQ